MCGLLPLTVAIAGGVVRNHGGLDEDLVAIIRADQLRGEADGVTVEERIIEASLRSLGEERAAVEAERYGFLEIKKALLAYVEEHGQL